MSDLDKTDFSSAEKKPCSSEETVENDMTVVPDEETTVISSGSSDTTEKETGDKRNMSEDPNVDKDLAGEEVQVVEETNGKTDKSDDSPNGFISKLRAMPRRALVAGAAGIALVALFASHVICFHDWRDATCTEPRTCAICGRTEGDALGHSWQPATCTEPETCERCGVQQGKPVGHKVKEWKTQTEATCANEGIAVGKCVNCGEEQKQNIPKTEHSFGDWVVDKEASCTEKGSQHRVCAQCGKTETQDIAMLDHTEGEWTVTKAPTITSSGTVLPGEKSLKCSVCGKVLKTEKVELNMSKSQLNAYKKGQSYLKYTSFSYKSLIKQLEFEGFSHDDAVFAVDNCGADWNEQAAKKAQSYLDYTSFSRSGLIKQLEFEGFTSDQARYGVDAVGL